MKVGDIVTRDGTDRHVVMRLDDDGLCGDFKCVAAPATGWISVGETESNLAARYKVIDQEAFLVNELEARERGLHHDSFLPKKR